MSITKELQKQMIEVEKAHRLGTFHRMSSVLAIMICGMLCNLQNISDIHKWAKSKPTLEFLSNEFHIAKIPCRAQFYNILANVNPEKFNIAFINWMKFVLQGDVASKTIAIDGKTVCSTDKLTPDGNPLHIVSAIISENNLVIGQLPCKTKISEPEAFRELVKMLNISGAIVVADALHCKKKSAETVVAEGGDYLFAVKDNEPNLKDDIKVFVQNEKLENFSKMEKNGGRIERRTAFVSQDIDWLENRDKWSNLQAIGAIHTEFEKDGKKSSEWHYYISSAPLTAENLLKHARLEWAVESMHWFLDVHFDEDRTKVWDMNVQKNLNIMRKIALNLAREYKRQIKPKSALNGILKDNLFDLQNLSKFLHFFFDLRNVTNLLIY